MLDYAARVNLDLRIEKAKTCLQSAEILFNAERFADAANRSYYSIFHAMQAVLTTTGFSSKKHSGVISEFQKKYVKTGIFPENFSDILKEAFRVRTKSDYEIHYVIAKSDVEQQIENSKIFLAGIEGYIKTI